MNGFLSAGWLFQTLGGGLAGLCCGSFIANFAHRWPDRLAGLATGRSQCESCGVRLGVADLVPVASWLVLGGKCRHCHADVPPYYTLVEALCGLIGLFSLALLPPLAGAAAALAGLVLLAMALIDLEQMLLPDILTLPLAGLGLALSLIMPFSVDDWAGPSPALALAGLLAGGGGFWLVRWSYRKIRGREGLGLGDVKLMGAAGAWLGPEPLVWVLLTAALAGLAMGLRKGLALNSATAIPFGPALAMAFWLVLLFSW